MYDVAIIGSGPAGLSAALNLKVHNKEVIWFGSEDLSLKVEKSEKIANYPGVALVAGRDLNKLFKEQIKEAGLEITDKMVTQITAGRKGFSILGDNEIYTAKAVLLATGSVSAKPMPGEAELLGMGVSYCATCDGFLYKNKTIAVHCTSKRYEHEVAYLAELAEHVYLSVTYPDCEIDLPNVEKLPGIIKSVQGQGKVANVELTDGSMREVEGLFILRTSVAPTALISGIEMEGPDIVVNRRMETSKKGIYAAGDCTGRPYQITKATGEGNVAAHSIIEYLSELN